MMCWPLTRQCMYMHVCKLPDDKGSCADKLLCACRSGGSKGATSQPLCCASLCSDKPSPTLCPA